MHEAALAAGIVSPYEEWLKNWEDKPEDADRVTTRVECAEYFPLRDAALIAHATQVDPAGRWFGLDMALQQSAWPTEDYELARSEVGRDIPEDDLFAGVRGAATGTELPA